MFAIASLSDSRYRYGYKGFTSIVTQLIEIAKMHESVYQNYRVQVQDSQVHEYFENVFFPDTEEESYQAGSVYLDKFFAGEIDTRYTAHTVADNKDLKKRFEVLSSVLVLKQHLLDKFEKKRAHLFGADKRVVGIQIRGTDKKSEITPPSLQNISNILSIAIETQNADIVHVATDDMSYRQEIKKYFGKIVVFDEEKEISTNGMPLHLGAKNRSIINEQVLEDVYLLSKVDYFLYSFSNVSQLALIMGINQHSEKKCINL